MSKPRKPGAAINSYVRNVRIEHGFQRVADRRLGGVGREVDVALHLWRAAGEIEQDPLTLHLNGQTIEVNHVEPAHTDGDSIVYFREADLLHMGDTFFSGIYPFIDTSSGGRIDGMIAAADRGLAIAGPKTRIIPGHGPLSSREDLAGTREMLISVRDRVRKLIDEGLDRDQVIASKPSKDSDGQYGGGFLKPDVFVGIVFDSLQGD